MAPKKFKMIGYAGSVVQSSWWGRLVFDVSGMSMKDRLPVLREHERDRAVGVLDKLTKEPSRLVGEGYFVDSADGLEVQALLKAGFPFQASVGIAINEVDEIGNDESVIVNGMSYEGPLVVVRLSDVHEISAVTLGADSQTSIDIAASMQGVQKMPKDFDEAVCLKLKNGLPVDNAIRAAARDYPGLYQIYRRQILGEPDHPGNADSTLAREAEALARREGIPLDLAMERIFIERPDLAAAWLEEL